MTLRTIVSTLGGDLYQGGFRASIPAPGHSAADRSVSLLLCQGRVVIHGFGAADWREVRDDLRARGLIDRDGRPTGSCIREGSADPACPRSPPLNAATRIAVAEALWRNGRPVAMDNSAGRHLLRRSAAVGLTSAALRFHPAAPVSVYRGGAGRFRPALLARISDDHDRLTAVELAYLEPGGHGAVGLGVPRKTVGRVPAGSAVRLFAAADQMLVAEGVMTTLSAVERFRLPGWALLSAHNLSTWTPPAVVGRVLIAADRGAAGAAAAERLRHRLIALGIAVAVAVPQMPFGDWNEAAARTPRPKGERKGPHGCRSGGDGLRRPAGDRP